jgi:hypothetical protein
MLSLDAIAERRIREAQERGEFDDLPAAGTGISGCRMRTSKRSRNAWNSGGKPDRRPPQVTTFS